MVDQTRARELSFCEGCEGLPAGTAPKPIQMQDRIAGVPQPIDNIFCLKRSISGAEVPIQQLGYLLSGARFLDLVQRSPHVFIKAIRVCRLAHLWFSGWEANLLKSSSFPCWSSAMREQQVTRNLLVSTEESICELPQAHAVRQNRPTYTIAQSPSVPRRASPNSRPRGIRRSTLASRPAGRQMRVRCVQ